MAKPDAKESEMREVLARVNLLGFLDGQKGVKTELLEQAENLSGASVRDWLLPERCFMTRRCMFLTKRPAILMQKVKSLL